MTQGVIFDLDGTLVDSRLDFELMRREMDLPPELPILEAVERLPEARRLHCHAILHRHECEGADRAEPLPGVPEFLAELVDRGTPLAIVTRNSREVTRRMLPKLAATFDPIITRDDGPVKPHPWAVHHICERWRVQPREVVMIGDFRFDIECGKAAGARTVFYAGGQTDAALDHADADFILPCFLQAPHLLAWIYKSL